MKNKKPNHQAAIYQMLAAKPIAYNPALAEALGSVNAGLLMAQLLYWQNKGSDSNWIYKTIEEMRQETGLSRANQETALKQIKAKGLIDVKLAGVPAKRHFKINLNRLTNYLTSLLESGKLHRPEPTNSTAGIEQTTTESTLETTSKNTPESFDLSVFSNKGTDTRTSNGWAKVSPHTQ